MLTNEYLYGEGVEVPPLDNYAIMRRLELLKEHLGELLSVDYRKRDFDRVRAVNKAITFWEDINEIR